MLPILLILALVIALVAIIFALQNSSVIFINFFVWQFEGSLSFVLLFTLTIGVAIGLLVLAPTVLKRSWKASGRKRRLQDLEDQYQGKKRDLAVEQQKLDILRVTHQELFSAFSLANAQTGLLQAHSVGQVLTYVLHQMQAANPAHRYESVSLYVIETEDLLTLEVRDPAATLSEIASMLQTHISPKSWLHSDGTQRFYCIALGLSSEAANDYGEFLRTVLQEHPVWSGNNTPTPIKLYVGGAIAHLADRVNSQMLQEKAEQACTKASRRGQNRFRMIEAAA